MSSARNHAKRSHRSERFKSSAFNAHARKVYIQQAKKPKRESLISKLTRLIHRKSAGDQY